MNPNIIYTRLGERKWNKTEFKEQCPEELLFNSQCQGVKGHKDVHWCYDAAGNFHWEDNKDDIRHEGCSGTTPPGHKQYITPNKMIEKHFNHAPTTELVVDEELIDKLEAGEVGEYIVSREANPEDVLRLAHKCSRNNKEELELSNKCGCFYCLKTYKLSDFKDLKWCDKGTTLLCPKCSIDSVIGSASGFPITQEFLKKMQDRWFNQHRPAKLLKNLEHMKNNDKEVN